MLKVTKITLTVVLVGTPGLYRIVTKNDGMSVYQSKQHCYVAKA